MVNLSIPIATRKRIAKKVYYIVILENMSLSSRNRISYLGLKFMGLCCPSNTYLSANPSKHYSGEI